MKARKLLALTGLVAAAAAFIPYSFINRDAETGEVSTYALLWRLRTRPNPEGGRRIELNFGFHNPLAREARAEKADCGWVCGEAEAACAREPSGRAAAPEIGPEEPVAPAGEG